MKELDRDLFYLSNTTISPVFWICILYIFMYIHSLQMKNSLLFLLKEKEKH